MKLQINNSQGEGKKEHKYTTPASKGIQKVSNSHDLRM